jgi:hypothetical protein
MECEECIICFYEKPLEDYICFSCGHKVCSLCYPMMNNICPVCRFNERDHIRITIIEQVTQNERVRSVINYHQILINSLCAVVCCAIIYSVVVVPIQSI